MQHLDTVLLAVITEVEVVGVVVSPGVQAGGGGGGKHLGHRPAVVQGEGGVVTGDTGGHTGALAIIVLVITALVTLRYLILKTHQMYENYMPREPPIHTLTF